MSTPLTSCARVSHVAVVYLSLCALCVCLSSYISDAPLLLLCDVAELERKAEITAVNQLIESQTADLNAALSVKAAVEACPRLNFSELFHFVVICRCGRPGLI